MVKTSTSAPSPLSPRRWPPESFPWWGSLALALAVLLAATVAVLVAIILIVTLHPAALSTLPSRGAPTSQLSWPVVIVQFAFDLAVLGVLSAGLPMLARRPLSGLGLHVPQARDFLWGLAGSFAMLVVAEIVGVLQDRIVHLKADQVTVQWLHDSRTLLVAALVVLAVPLAPIVEELTFRGFLFNALRRYTPVWIAATISGILFGLSHSSTGVGSIAPLAAAGIILATVYYRSGSLVASMFTHGLFNAFTVVAVLGFHQK